MLRSRLATFLILSLFSFAWFGCSSGGGGGGNSGGGASSGNGGIMKIGWYPNTESDLAGYRIYYGKSSVGTFSNSIDVGMAAREADLVVFSVTNLIKEDNYCIALTAYNTSNNESGFSNAWGDVCGNPW